MDLLDSYFGDQTLDEGLSEIVSVSAQNIIFHSEILDALDSAIAAAEQGDASVLDPVRDHFLRYRRDDEAVRKFMGELRTEYLRLYVQSSTAR